MSTRLEDYALLGDLQTAALVGRDGSVDWLCLPRFDSPACFAALLDTEEAGCWQLAPAAGGACVRRAYREDTLILESDWETATGTVRVIDFMPPRGQAADLVRIVVGITGIVPMRMMLRLRFDYGRIVPWVRHIGGRLVATAGPDSTWLDCAVPTEGRDLTTYADFEVVAGERVPFVLTHHASHLDGPEPIDAAEALAGTEAFWQEWAAGCTYAGKWAPAVRRSLITLKALTYAPTGAIVAAATTSVPEDLGGERNWDYRYVWLRDATMTLQALLDCGFREEAAAWREWLLRAIAGDPADLQTLYALDGARRVPELTLDWLAGYEKSTPVRVGNAADSQLQLDVWGEVLDGFHTARKGGLRDEATGWAIQRKLLEFLEENWRREDHGLWEVRGERRHFVHSKVMAWVGFDRGVQAVERFGLDGPAERWRSIRDAIHAEVCERGYDAARGVFTQFYGSRGLDASLLLIPRVGFLPWDDPRVARTVEAVQAELDHDGLLLRYRPDVDGSSDGSADGSAAGTVDGLPGDEGAFLICTFWLVDALHGLGRSAQATELFERLVALCNDVGLLSEQYDARYGRLVGNIPQAFSHIGLVNSARHLSGFSTGP